MDILSSFSIADLELLEKLKTNSDKLGLGPLCVHGHAWENTERSLRYKSNGRCYFCRTRNNVGIYKIECNGHVYIGQSVDIKERWYSHISALRRKDHANNFLQNIFNKYGEECLVFSTLFLMDKKFAVKIGKNLMPSILNSLEQTFFNIYDPDINICKVAGTNLGVERSEDHIAITAASRAKPFTLYHPLIGRTEGINLSKFARDNHLPDTSGLYSVIRGISMSYKGYFKDEASYRTWQLMKDSYTSKFTGVSLQHGKWKSSIYYPGTKKCEYLGLFEDEFDASLAYQQAQIDIMNGVFDKKINERKKKLKDKKLSKHTGVTWDKTRNHWKAFIRFQGKRIHLGAFKDEYSAFQRRQKAEKEKADGTFVPPKPVRSSTYKGVSWDKSKKKWVAQAWIAGKAFFIGYYKIEIEAHYAYENYMSTHRASA